MPLISYCGRCEQPNDDLTHCHSVDDWLCEECIITLAQHYYEITFIEAVNVLIPIAPEPDPDAA